MKIILDTNVLISALIKKGKPERLFTKLVRKEAELILSPQILKEFLEIIRKPKFAKYVDESKIESFAALVQRTSRIVKVTSKFNVTLDLGDNLVLSTAFDGKADYIVSGDQHLLRVKEFKEIKIVTAEEMLRILSRL